MSTPILRAVLSPGGTPVECSISDILDAAFGTVSGRSITRAATQWQLAAPNTTYGVLTFNVAGTLSVANDVCPWVSVPQTFICTNGYVIAKTAPTGQNLIFDTLMSTDLGATFNTIWGTGASLPALLASSNQSPTTGPAVFANFPGGSILKTNITQVGSGAAGANLTIALYGYYQNT